MAIIHIDTEVPRELNGLLLAATSEQWVEGPVGTFLVPSQSRSGYRYKATEATCTCQDFIRRQLPCKHAIAVHIYLALRSAVTTRVVVQA